ncbi:MAG: prolipoprotein diacylglyceryl transferase [Schleiferiaceae bacterium]|nr:prolipoprotein diacylglyceryl transferase [Schleiferiaceae bacterium]
MDVFSKFFWIEDNQVVFNLYLSSSWYPILYQLAFFLGLCVFVSYGIRKKYPMSSWLIISATASFLLVVGSKLGTFSLSDWQLFIQTGQLEATGNKTALGAAILVVVFLGVMVKAIRFKGQFWGAFAFFLPVMMLVQRVGCMLAGCCYGKPLESVGGVKYFGPSYVRDQQIHENALSITESISLPVHNVPLYFAAVALITIFVLTIAQRKLKDGRQLVLVSLISMLVGRFTVEFFRDLQAHNIHQKLTYGLTQQQWFLVVMFFVFVFVFFRLKNRQMVNNDEIEATPRVFPMRNLLALLGLAVLLLILKEWFTVYEKSVLYFQMALAGILNIKVVWSVEKQLKPLVAPLTLFAATAFVMAQEAPNYIEESSGVYGNTYINTSGSFNRLHGVGYPCSEIDYRPSGCGGGSGTPYCVLADTAKAHGPGYSSFQFGVEQSFVSAKNGSGVAVGVDFANESYYNRENNYRKNYNHYSIFTKFDFPYIGLTLGFRSGNFYDPTDIFNEDIRQTKGRFGLRFGSDQKLFRVSFGVYDEYMPSGIHPAPYNINSSFRLKNTENLMIRPGLATGLASRGFNQSSFYGLSTDIYLKKMDLMIRPTLGISVNGNPNVSTRNAPHFALQLRKGFANWK